MQHSQMMVIQLFPVVKKRFLFIINGMVMKIKEETLFPDYIGLVENQVSERSDPFHKLKWNAYSRWLLGPDSAWSSTETTTTSVDPNWLVFKLIGRFD